MRAIITILITFLLSGSSHLNGSTTWARRGMNQIMFILAFLFFPKKITLVNSSQLLLARFYRHHITRSGRYLFLLLLLSLLSAFAGSVTAANLAPEAVDVRNFPIQTGSGRSQILPLIGKDADGSIANFIILTLPAASKGTLYLNGIAITVNQVLTPANAQMLQFTPFNTFTGDCSFSFTVTDNQGLTDTSPASYIIPIVAISQNLVCTGGGLGTNILGTMGTFSAPFIVPSLLSNCINNGAIGSVNPPGNLGVAHPELTSYTYASTSGSLGPEGTYSFLKVIGTWSSRNCIKTDWVAADHTGDGGYAMIVNGSPNVTSFGSTFFKANTISVCPNTLYEFSAYVI
ncbi:MAG: hypothetical protein GZ094_19695, partial [Mariniphaga sp.]|nr:hypothetical protein [Mariniphaga sp.]